MDEKIFKIEDIDKISKEILREIKNKKTNKATILAFFGDLGAGKTTITQAISRNLGIENSVLSPTFVIMKIYKTKDKIYKNLIHIDAYRLEGSKELLKLGWEEILKNKDNLIIIEWPENVLDYIPSDTYSVKIMHKDDNTRSIKFSHNLL